MIKNIIFDFGDVFINLDKTVVSRELLQVHDFQQLADLKNLNDQFEIGAISATVFIQGLQRALPGKSSNSILSLWNSMLLDFPESRLRFLESLANSGSFRMFLLSNTNEIHIAHVLEKMGKRDYQRFRDCFEGFYLSHEIRLRKPEKAIFDFVLSRHDLLPTDTLFIDDTLENIESAASMGVQTWHLQVGRDDICHLKSKL